MAKKRMPQEAFVLQGNKKQLIKLGFSKDYNVFLLSERVDGYLYGYLGKACSECGILAKLPKGSYEYSASETPFKFIFNTRKVKLWPSAIYRNKKFIFQ